MPLVCAGEDCPAMQGLSLRNVAVTVYNGKKKAVFRDFGELLFTHFGVSDRWCCPPAPICGAGRGSTIR